ncbi:MAG: 50S ribosomal protein L23 [Bacteroidetes bacterium RIFCSPLOWO2_02_FULL_36_8]|nr:MAG: 50S ribosomal protein L23 [Bacteroidetes bacterium RIFCSPLOWO2_02_FULL_36_8]OFY69398.1 MAG: 50S ribosomal protein L23 [Bacteroidetes bacterium RIFCSPLOWO2_12_FULL_37_12]
MNILIKPLTTEKLTKQTGNIKLYGFVVDRRANKIDVKNAVERSYGVNVDDVRTMNYKPKNKSRMTKTGIISGKTKSVKKAIVTLKTGEEIDFYATV